MSADFFGDHGGDEGRLDRVLELVLPVRRAVLELPERTQDLRVQARAARFDGGLLPGRLDAGFDLLPRLLHDLLDACWVNAAVEHELRQRHACDLAADGVEAGEGHRVGRVVDNQVDAGGALQRADVAALAADDAALHVVAWDGHDRHRRLRDDVGHQPLHGGGEDAPSAAVGLLLRLGLDRADDAVRLFAGLGLDLAQQEVARLLARHAGNAFDLGDLRLAEFFEFGADGFLLPFALLVFGFLAFECFEFAVEVLFPGSNTLLKPQHFVAPRFRLLFGLSPDLNRLLFRAEEDLLLLCLCL
jgi:hypothetical protein